MKTKLNLMAILLVLFAQASLSKTYDEYAIESNIKFPFTEDNTPYSDVVSYKFKKLLEQWEKKEIQEKQIAEYEKYGISKALATRAVNERLRSARAVVQDNKFDDRNISPIADNLDNRIATMKHIALLGHQRFKKLMGKYEMEVDDGFYQCLCSSKGIIGTGLGYSPEPDKHCNNTDPCKGGNWGCASSDIPKEANSWIACATKYRLKNGGNIFQHFDKHVNTSNKFNQDELARNLFDRTVKFKKLCLPAMDAKSITDIQSIFKNNITKQAINISESAENTCEEAISVDLFLKSNKGMKTPELAISLIKPWVMTKELSEIETFLNSDKGKNYIFGQIKSALVGKIPYSGKINNLLSNASIILSELKAHSMDKTYKQAFGLFATSKKWNMKRLKAQEQEYDEQISLINMQLKEEDSHYEMIYNRDQIELEATKGYKPRNNIALALHPHSSTWKTFFNNQQALRKKTDLRKLALINDRMKLLLFKKVISEYRIPLNIKGCDEFIKDRLQQCKEEFIRKSREFKLEQG